MPAASAGADSAVSLRRVTRRRARDHDGFATVWGLIWIAVVSSIGGACMLVAVAVAQQHHVDGAADVVALSAATRLQVGVDGCETAAQRAADNLVRLDSCDREGRDIVVEVSAALNLPLGLDGRLVSRARAGPSQRQ